MALTAGSTLAADPRSPVRKLAGVRVLLGGEPLDLIFASPTQVNGYVHPGIALALQGAELEVQVGDEAIAFDVAVRERTPGIFVVTVHETYLTIWATGFGPVETRGELEWTTVQPMVLVNGSEVTVLYSGLAPGWLGLYQVNVLRTDGLTFPAEIELEFGDSRTVATVEE